MKKSQKIKALKKYFEKKPEVILAFLFGSQSKNLAGKISDYDIAVLLKESSKKEKNFVKNLERFSGHFKLRS
jgi:predicted nucleotidyltransferase